MRQRQQEEYGIWTPSAMMGGVFCGNVLIGEGSTEKEAWLNTYGRMPTKAERRNAFVHTLEEAEDLEH